VIEPRERDEASARPPCGQVLQPDRLLARKPQQAADEGKSPPIGRRIEGGGLRPRRIVAGTGMLASPVMNVVKGAQIQIRFIRRTRNEAADA
jgi:hypothetical protein